MSAKVAQYADTYVTLQRFYHRHTRGYLPSLEDTARPGVFDPVERRAPEFTPWSSTQLSVAQ